MRPVSDESERRLTGAIERAASAVAAGGGDCSGTLARELLAEGVDGRFAKVASDSFNKRLTVLRLSRLDDDRRPDSFPLADADEVRAAMGMPTMGKTASAEDRSADLRRGAFEMRVVPRPMAKVAAATPERAPRQGILDGPGGLERLERTAASLLESQEAFIRGGMAKLAAMGRDEERMREELSDELSRAGGGVRQKLANAYGERLTSVMPELGAERVHPGVPERSPVFAKAAALMDLHEEIDELHGVMEEHARGVEELVAGASLLAMAKEAATEPDKPSVLADIVGGGTDLVGNVINGPVKTTVDALLGVGRAVEEQRMRHNSLRPDAIITSKFLTGDRYLDRLVSWSDVAADPALAIYPAEQVFGVTQKVMNLHPALERPDQREALKAIVGQVLAQNGRIAPQDHAAAMVALKDVGKALGATDKARAAVEALDKAEAPSDAPTLITENLAASMTSLPKSDPGAERMVKGLSTAARKGKNLAVYGMTSADSLTVPDHVRMLDALRDRAKSLGYSPVVTKDSDGTFRVVFANSAGEQVEVGKMLDIVRSVRV